MTLYRRDLLIGTGAVMTTAAFLHGCGRARSVPRSLDAASRQTPPIVEALRYGITAPSAHNTQPWLIELVSDTEARLYLDRARMLPATDPPARQVHISHGTLVELMAIAATRLGHVASVDVLPEGAMTHAELGNKPTAAIRLIEAPDASVDPLFEQVLARRTSRLPHEGALVTLDELTAIAAQTRSPKVHTRLIREEHLPEALAIVRSAMAVEVNDYEVYDETRQWFRFSKREIREHRDGLSINTSGLTGFAAGSANLFLTSKSFHKKKNRSRYLESFGKTVDSTRGLLTMTTETNTMSDWIDTGRAYMRAQLAAQAMGLRFHPVSQVLQEYPRMDALRSSFDALADVTSPAKVQMLVRIGRTATPGLSPRRPAANFIATPSHDPGSSGARGGG